MILILIYLFDVRFTLFWCLTRRDCVCVVVLDVPHIWNTILLKSLEITETLTAIGHTGVMTSTIAIRTETEKAALTKVTITEIKQLKISTLKIVIQEGSYECRCQTVPSIRETICKLPEQFWAVFVVSTIIVTASSCAFKAVERRRNVGHHRSSLIKILCKRKYFTSTLALLLLNETMFPTFSD